MKSVSLTVGVLGALLVFGTLNVLGTPQDNDYFQLSQLSQLFREEIFQQLTKTKFMEPRCPYPFTNVMDECFYLANFHLNWNNARHHCIGMGADLATPQHLYALKSFLIQELSRTGWIWIGGTDEKQEGDWRWLHGGQIDQKDWADGQPNNDSGGQHCLILQAAVHPTLNDHFCNRTGYFACQYQGY